MQTAKPRFQLKPFHIAEMIAIGGIATDVATSWGCVEANPLLRSADGRFGGQGLAIKVGVTGGMIAMAHWLHRKHPSLDRPMGFALGLAGGSLHALAIRNHSVGCRR